LNQLSAFWFEKLKSIVPNHVITCDITEMPDCIQPFRSQLQGRAMMVQKLTILPIEVIVRGYLAGKYLAHFMTPANLLELV
jgi:phosphoribosylaminoimidazole-succinocarboxamide synthase